MPNLECLNLEIAELKKGQSMQASQILKLAYEVSELTELTKETKADTAEIVELMRWLTTTKKIVLWVGGLLAGAWAIVELIRDIK
jgi:hypothetical protein